MNFIKSNEDKLRISHTKKNWLVAEMSSVQSDNGLVGFSNKQERYRYIQLRYFETPEWFGYPEKCRHILERALDNSQKYSHEYRRISKDFTKILHI